MKKFNLSKAIILVLLVLLAAFGAISITAHNYQTNTQPSSLTKLINDSAAGIDRIFAAPGQFFQTKAADFQEIMNVYKQNESLKKQLSDSVSQKQQLDTALQENKELKAALALKETLSDYKIITASVITRNPSSWNDLLVIDKGADASLVKGMIVMANGGIIGRVSQVNGSSAKVELLTGSKNLVDKLPVKIGSSYGFLNSYDQSRGQYVVTNIMDSSNFTKGESVVTSGLGDSTSNPANLPLGTVIGQKGKSTDSTREVYVKPSSNFYDIHFVSIVQQAQGATP